MASQLAPRSPPRPRSLTTSLLRLKKTELEPCPPALSILLPPARSLSCFLPLLSGLGARARHGCRGKAMPHPPSLLGTSNRRSTQPHALQHLLASSPSQRSAGKPRYRRHGRLSEQSSLAVVVLPLRAPKPAPPPPLRVRLNPYDLSPASHAAWKAAAVVLSSAAATALVAGPTQAASSRAEQPHACASAPWCSTATSPTPAWPPTTGAASSDGLPCSDLHEGLRTTIRRKGRAKLQTVDSYE